MSKEVGEIEMDMLGGEGYRPVFVSSRIVVLYLPGGETTVPALGEEMRCAANWGGREGGREGGRDGERKRGGREGGREGAGREGAGREGGRERERMNPWSGCHVYMHIKTLTSPLWATGS